jgi:hypothetical protein
MSGDAAWHSSSFHITVVRHHDAASWIALDRADENLSEGLSPVEMVVVVVVVVRARQ